MEAKARRYAVANKPRTALKVTMAVLALVGLSGCGVILPPAPMSKTEAAELYLSNVCKSNKSSADLGVVFDAKPFDLQLATQKAGLVRDSYSRVASALSSDKVAWPEDIRPDVTAFVDSLYEDIAAVNPMVAATDQASFTASAFSYVSALKNGKSPGLAQKIRAKLDLPADTVASCKGR